MISVMLYSRKECHLCEEAQKDLEALQEKIPHTLTVVDIDDNLDLTRAYGFEIPVIEVGPYKLKAPFTKQELEVTLAAADQRRKQLEGLQDPGYKKLVDRGRTWGKLDGFSYWLSRHYLALFNLFVFIYVSIPFMAPALMKAGLEGPANVIYVGFRVVCHQLPYRSFFILGEQPFYPRAAAGLNGYMTFQEATGMSESNYTEDILAAQRYVGNDVVGYKVALCERDVSIYLGILFFGLVFGLSRKRIPPLPWYLWIILGLVPIGIDGVSQLLSQPPINLFPYRESTPYLRMITGALFGLSTAWFGYPLLEESMTETRKILAVKKLRVKKFEEKIGQSSEN